MNPNTCENFQRLISAVAVLPAIPTAVAHPWDEFSVTSALDTRNPRGRKRGEVRRWSLADSAVLVLGARVPITLTSRADSMQSRLASCVVAAVVAGRRRELAGKVS
jgi:hypothetical protein